jgi:hypothetical protein
MSDINLTGLIDHLKKCNGNNIWAAICPACMYQRGRDDERAAVVRYLERGECICGDYGECEFCRREPYAEDIRDGAHDE